jgi:hypothetical protein
VESNRASADGATPSEVAPSARTRLKRARFGFFIGLISRKLFLKRQIGENFTRSLVSALNSVIYVVGFLMNDQDIRISMR